MKYYTPIRKNGMMPFATTRGFPGSTSGKELACQCRRPKRCRFEPLEEGMATPSSTLAWEIPWTEKPGRL